MTPRETRLIKASFIHFEKQLPAFAQLLYQRLFEANPDFELLFKGDQKQQERQLAGMLANLVAGLDRLDALKPTLWSLGRRHTTYGVRAKDYEAFGDALLSAVETVLGEAATPQCLEAWNSLFAFVSGVMQGRIGRHLSVPAMPEPVD